MNCERSSSTRGVERLAPRRPPDDTAARASVPSTAQERGEDSLPVLRALEHRGAGAVAEQHAGRAILPVDDRAQLLGADDERRLGVARVIISPSATIRP